MAWSKVSRHKRGYGHLWDKLRAHVLIRDSYLCQPCMKRKRVTPATQVDHITPKARGGTEGQDNLQAICAPCHAEKSLREAAAAQGRVFKAKVTIGTDGWPID